MERFSDPIAPVPYLELREQRLYIGPVGSTFLVFPMAGRVAISSETPRSVFPNVCFLSHLENPE